MIFIMTKTSKNFAKELLLLINIAKLNLIRQKTIDELKNIIKDAN